ncbi:MAG: helix-turn-helix transcriptional regulator, partial [Bacteroidales bacterium]|nr:helix-turn-helix transcriptional regulator [Bacteroidales bacterium]
MAQNERMKRARKELGLSQEELARKIGVSRQTINMIERGDYNPTLKLCIQLCHA